MIRLAALVLAVGCAAEAEGPRLHAVMPQLAGAGATVTITGERLCDGVCESVGGAIRVGIDQPVQVTEILAYDDASAMFRIPSIAATGRSQITVTVAGRTSNALAFEVARP